MSRFIAEIGSNWWKSSNDDGLKRAMHLISEAQNAGANIVKFQIFTADTLYSKERAPELHARARKYELPSSWLGDLRSHANFCGVELWASVFDPELAWSVCAYLQGIKIASGDLTYDALIAEAAKISCKSKYPLAISTGAATEEEINHALNVAHSHSPFKVILFHCNSTYPADQEAMNLRAGLIFRDRVDAIGLSDHTEGSISCCLGAGVGYTYFEKHFRGYQVEDTPDAPISLMPNQFRALVDEVKKCETILGEPKKRVFASEVGERRWARRGEDGLRPRI